MQSATRRLGNRFVGSLLPAVILLGLPGASLAQAPGQVIVAGPGSTVQGDILRGEGVAATGFGQYNLATAMANSINTDTAIKWNQYVYLSIEEDLQKKYIHRMQRRQAKIESNREQMRRILEQPNQSDLLSGDALNYVLVQLVDPRISPSSLRSAVVPLAGETIRRIPFVYSARKATFSMERMLGKRNWPIGMRGTEFGPERRAYERAVDHAIELDVEGKLTGEAVDAVEQAIKGLSDRIDLSIPATRSTDQVQARNHVKMLSEIPRFLRERAVEKVIAEIDTYPGTSVGDLVQFMQRHNLRFGVASTPDENVLYASLFDSLRKLRDQVAVAADPAADPRDR